MKLKKVVKDMNQFSHHNIELDKKYPTDRKIAKISVGYNYI